MVIDTLQPRRGRRKEEMVVNTLQPRRGRRKEEMVVTTLPFLMLIPVDNGGHPTAAVDNDLKPLALSVITMLPFPMLIPVDNDLKSLALSAITMLPFPMLIPVDDNLKSLALSVDVVSTIGRDTEPVVADSRTLVAPESLFLIGGDTAQTVDVSDLPQKTKGGVTGRTETASRSPSSTRL